MPRARRIRSIPHSAAAGVRGAGAEQHAVGRDLGHADAHRLIAGVQQPVQDPAPAAQQTVHPGPRGAAGTASAGRTSIRTSRPSRGAGAAPALTRPAWRSDARRPGTSGVPTIGRPPTPRRELTRASLRAPWRRTSASVAAPATNPVAAAAAAWTAGRTGEARSIARTSASTGRPSTISSASSRRRRRAARASRGAGLGRIGPHMVTAAAVGCRASDRRPAPGGEALPSAADAHLD